MNGDVRIKMLSSLNPKPYIEYGIIWNQAQRARYDMATAIRVSTMSWNIRKFMKCKTYILSSVDMLGSFA